MARVRVSGIQMAVSRKLADNLEKILEHIEEFLESLVYYTGVSPYTLLVFFLYSISHRSKLVDTRALVYVVVEHIPCIGGVSF